MTSQLKICANWVVRITGSVIFLALTWYAFRYTQYMVPMQGYEYPVDRKDSEWMNLLAAALLGIVMLGMMRMEKKLSLRIQLMIQRVVLGISMLWQGAWGYLWIAAADRCPKGDQESVYQSAVRFLSGDYHPLSKGSYCGLYPHQLGLAALEEGIFRLSGTTDYHVIQFLFVGMISATIFFIYQILKELTGQFTCVVTGTLLGGMCTAQVFYSCWVYGEVPYVFFAMLAMWMLTRYIGKRHKRYLVLFVFAVTFAMLVRENALILIVAFGLSALVKGLAEKDRHLIAAILCAVLIPLICYQGIFKMYEARSGYEHSTGLPSNDFVYIGLQETEGRYGWDYYKSYQVYYDNGKDTKRTEEAVNRMIADRWQEMRSRPGYLKTFFKGKILSQWNAPLYQSLYFNYVHEDVHKAGVTAFLDSLSGDNFFRLLWAADRLQFVLYLGMLCYFAFGVTADSDPLEYVLAVTIIGGFLFSVIWEAKTRYIFPYYMMMFPMAVLGYRAVWMRISKIKKRKWRQDHEKA